MAAKNIVLYEWVDELIKKRFLFLQMGMGQVVNFTHWLKTMGSMMQIISEFSFSSTQFNQAHTYQIPITHQAVESAEKNQSSTLLPIRVWHGNYALISNYQSNWIALYVTQNSKHFNELFYLFITMALHVRNDHHTHRRGQVFYVTFF